jgi:hypothetical protein
MQRSIHLSFDGSACLSYTMDETNLTLTGIIKKALIQGSVISFANIEKLNRKSPLYLA